MYWRNSISLKLSLRKEYFTQSDISCVSWHHCNTYNKHFSIMHNVEIPSVSQESRPLCEWKNQFAKSIWTHAHKANIGTKDGPSQWEEKDDETNDETKDIHWEKAKFVISYVKIWSSTVGQSHYMSNKNHFIWWHWTFFYQFAFQAPILLPRIRFPRLIIPNDDHDIPSPRCVGEKRARLIQEWL
jgi:hypothetical protein